MMLVKTFVRFSLNAGCGEIMVDPASVVAIEADGDKSSKLHLVGVTGAISIDCNHEKAARRVIKGVDYMKLRTDAQAARDALVPESGEEE
ncbi:MAG: hypothetical protein E6Q97_18245 [Desulfurellales bacterium]|nr:MAG: hypothetical protein E6Q97_18245 [Desulfurellales bacterium]